MNQAIRPFISNIIYYLLASTLFPICSSTRETEFNWEEDAALDTDFVWEEDFTKETDSARETDFPWEADFAGLMDPD